MVLYNKGEKEEMEETKNEAKEKENNAVQTVEKKDAKKENLEEKETNQLKEQTKKETIENAYKKIGENVAKARKKRKMSQLALSLEMGYKSVSVISFAEICLNGAHFNLAHLMQISSILEVPLATFFESVEEIIKNP